MFEMLRGLPKVILLKKHNDRVCSIRAEGFFIIKQDGRKPVVTKFNHLVNSFLYGIMTTLGVYSAPPTYGAISNSFVIGFGSDITHPTLATMTYLETIVSYKPDSGVLGGVTKESDGQYRCVWRCVWSAGHFAENKSLGEVALHLNATAPVTDSGTPTKTNTNYPATWFDGTMCSRVSVEDGDFTVYTVDYTKSLTIEYWLRMTMV